MKYQPETKYHRRPRRGLLKAEAKYGGVAGANPVHQWLSNHAMAEKNVILSKKWLSCENGNES